MALNYDYANLIENRMCNIVSMRSYDGICTELCELRQKILLLDLSGFNNEYGCMDELIKSLYHTYRVYKYNDVGESGEVEKRAMFEDCYNSLLAITDVYPEFKSDEKQLDNCFPKLDSLLEKPEFDNYMRSYVVKLMNKSSDLLTKLSKDSSNFTEKPVSSEVINVCKELFELDDENYKKATNEEIKENIDFKKDKILFETIPKLSPDSMALTNIVYKVTNQLYGKDYYETPVVKKTK